MHIEEVMTIVVRLPSIYIGHWQSGVQCLYWLLYLSIPGLVCVHVVGLILYNLLKLITDNMVKYDQITVKRTYKWIIEGYEKTKKNVPCI